MTLFANLLRQLCYNILKDSNSLIRIRRKLTFFISSTKAIENIMSHHDNRRSTISNYLFNMSSSIFNFRLNSHFNRLLILYTLNDLITILSVLCNNICFRATLDNKRVRTCRAHRRNNSFCKIRKNLLLNFTKSFTLNNIIHTIKCNTVKIARCHYCFLLLI